MQTTSTQLKRNFLLQWTLVTALGWTIGRLMGIVLAVVLVGAIGMSLSFAIDWLERSTGFLMGWIGSSVIFSTIGCIGGAIVGAMQGLVLKEQQADRWVLFTATGGALGTTLAGTVLWILPVDLAVYIGSTVTGLIIGTGIGIMQWLSLRKWVYKARYWVLANAIGWTVAEVLLWAVFWAMGWTGSTFNGVVIDIVSYKGLAVAFLCGGIIGLVTGIALVWLVNHSSREQPVL